MIIGVVLWLGLYFRDPRLRQLIPFGSGERGWSLMGWKHGGTEGARRGEGPRWTRIKAGCMLFACDVSLSFSVVSVPLCFTIRERWDRSERVFDLGWFKRRAVKAGEVELPDVVEPPQDHDCRHRDDDSVERLERADPGDLFLLKPATPLEFGLGRRGRFLVGPPGADAGYRGSREEGSAGRALRASDAPAGIESVHGNKAATSPSMERRSSG